MLLLEMQNCSFFRKSVAVPQTVKQRVTIHDSAILPLNIYLGGIKHMPTQKLVNKYLQPALFATAK